MPRHEVPRRILNVRRLARHDLWDVVRFKIVDGRRMLRKWLVSRITLFDGPAIMQIDGLPTSASRLL